MDVDANTIVLHWSAPGPGMWAPIVRNRCQSFLFRVPLRKIVFLKFHSSSSSYEQILSCFTLWPYKTWFIRFGDFIPTKKKKKYFVIYTVYKRCRIIIEQWSLRGITRSRISNRSLINNVYNAEKNINVSRQYIHIFFYYIKGLKCFIAHFCISLMGKMKVHKTDKMRFW